MDPVTGAAGAGPRTTRMFVVAAGALALVVGALVLVGWALDINVLKSVLPEWVSMKPNTALAFLLCGSGMLLSRRRSTPNADESAAAPDLSTPWSRAGRLGTLLAGLIGLLSLCEYAFGWNPGFDQWLFPEPPGAVATSHPGRMAPDTALCFVLFAAGWELARRPRRRIQPLVASLLFGAALAVLAVIEILSYFTPSLRTYGWGGLTMMALPTALVFAALGAALILTALPRKMPASDLPAGDIGRSDRDSGLKFVLIFVALFIGITAVGINYYRSSEQLFRATVEQQLASVGDLKVADLTQWRKERLADGNVLFRNPSFSALVRRFFARPADADARRQLQDWLGRYAASYKYDQVRLMDAHGVTRLVVPGEAPPPAAITLRLVPEVLRSEQIVFQDLFRHEGDGRVYMQVMIPLFEDLAAQRPLGVVNLHIDPSEYLFPFIQKWPVSSATAETLLVRREGDEALFLNALRFRPDAALVLRSQLISGSNLPATKAVLGESGVIEGVDYRGMPVLAALRRIPDSPWFLVAKVDSAEAFAPMRGKVWQVAAVICILILGAGAGVGSIWWAEILRFRRKLEVSADALHESDKRARFALDVVEMGDWDLDLIDHSAHRSLRHDQIFGYETLLPQWTFEIFMEHVVPEDRAIVEQSFQQAIESKGTWNFECRIIRRDGEQRWILAAGQVRLDAAGNPRRMVGVVQDITRRKQYEMAILHDNEELEKRVRERTAGLVTANKEIAAVNAELEQFAYVASHDLQEPLRMVVGYVQLLEKRLAGKLDGDTLEFMAFAVDGALRMQTLIQDILAYSRVSTKGQTLAPVDSAATLKDALVLLASRITETGAEVTAPQPLPRVMADRTQLVQLFQNLIGNALKFCKDPAPRVRVEAAHEAGWWRFSVTDNGIGIEPEYRAQLFVIFKRLHTRREYPGTGIGLAICKRIVERHGGEIGIESAPGGGTVFWFTLPEEKSP
jgi:signal transduction histidine kinase